MNKVKLIKISLVLVAIISVIFSVISIAKIINPKSGRLISNLKLTEIRASLRSTTVDTDSLNLISVEGNKRYLCLTFKDVRHSGQEAIYPLIYDTKKKIVIQSLEYKDNYINLVDSCLIKYVDKDIFIALSSNGSIYSIDTANDTIKVNAVVKTNISKNNIYKYIFVGKSLYVITRDSISKFNENTLSNAIVHEVNFEGNSYKKASIKEHTFESGDFVYSFVINSVGDVGVVYSNSLLIESNIVNKHKLISDYTYFNKIPNENKHYKFVDVSNISIKFLNTGNIIPISEDMLRLEYLNSHSILNKEANLNICSPYNMPLVVGDMFYIYSDESYEYILSDPPILTSSNINAIYNKDGNFAISDIDTDINTTNKEESITIRSNLLWYNYKKYIAFFVSNKGLVGVTNRGDMKLLTDSTISYIDNDICIYVKDGSVFFKK